MLVGKQGSYSFNASWDHTDKIAERRGSRKKVISYETVKLSDVWQSPFDIEKVLSRNLKRPTLRDRGLFLRPDDLYDQHLSQQGLTQVGNVYALDSIFIVACFYLLVPTNRSVLSCDGTCCYYVKYLALNLIMEMSAIWLIGTKTYIRLPTYLHTYKF